MNTIELPKVGISGKVLQWEVINADGSVDQSCYRPSDNVITDVGLDFLGMSDYGYMPFYYFCIGTGTSEPSATDTKLTTETYRARCAYAPYDSTTYSTAGSDPYYIYTQRGVQTELGALNGTYGEIGFAYNEYPSINTNIFSKHRLKDENGDPTTITVSSAQQLRLKYILTWCISPSTITTGTINVSGIGDIAYEAKWQDLLQFETSKSMFTTVKSTTGNTGLRAETSPITFSNIGTARGYTGISQTSRSAVKTTGINETKWFGYWDVNTANGTWYGVSLVNVNYGKTNFLIKFTTPFVKANTHTMRFTIKISWGRA